MHLEYNAYSSTGILNSFAHYFGGRVNGNSFYVPEVCGEGYLYAYNFSSGISALAADLRLKKDVIIKRNQHASTQYFVLLFNELPDRPEDNNANKVPPGTFDMGTNAVRLSSSLISAQSMVVANYRMRSVTIIFTKQALLDFLDFETVEKFMNIYFSFYLKKNFVTPMDAEFKWIIQELHREIKTHPLQNLFTENRILLMLEKFLYNFMVKEQHSGKKLEFKEEEISRLVKAENMLLEDFSKASPRISVLSKACAMSPTKFKNDFKMLYGLPVYEYYQKNRMAYARSLIQDCEHAIKEVGMMVGYSNLGHFAAAFKKEHGMLPSEWLHANKLHYNQTHETPTLPDTPL